MNSFLLPLLFKYAHSLAVRAFALSLLLPVAAVALAPCDRVKAEPDIWVKARTNALVFAARRAYERESAERAYERVVDGIADTIDKCRLAQDTDFKARFPEFLGFVKTLAYGRLTDHELGFNVPDRVYFEETRQYVEIPDFLLTPDFLRAASRYESLPQAKSMLRQLNASRPAEEQLIFFSYISRHLGTPDTPESFRRLLIVVPGNAALGIPEKWVQFGIPDPRARAPVRNVSVVAALPGSDGTTNVYFKDYFRTFGRNGLITIKGRWELGEGDDNCAQCHKSGVLPIFPESGSVSRDELPMVEVVNERFLTYPRPRFGKYLDATKLGPGLGSARPDGTARAAHRSTEKDVVCSACHHAEGLGALNWPMDRVLISSYVRDGEMPLGYGLKRVERARLYTKLIQDYFAIEDSRPGILKAWLLGGSRESGK